LEWTCRSDVWTKAFDGETFRSIIWMTISEEQYNIKEVVKEIDAV